MSFTKYNKEDQELIERLCVDDLLKKKIKIDIEKLKVYWVNIYDYIDYTESYYNFIKDIENPIDDDNKKYIMYDNVTDKYYYINSNNESIKSLAWEIVFPRENSVVESTLHELYLKNLTKKYKSNYILNEEIESACDNKLNALRFNNSIMKYLDELVNDVSLLDDNSKELYYSKIQELIIEYCDRYKNIINQDKYVINLEADDFDSLKFNMLAKIVELELQVDESKRKDKQLKELESDVNLLSEKINDLTMNKNEVKVKKLNNNYFPKLIKLKKDYYDE